jgi:hypothetical protein
MQLVVETIFQERTSVTNGLKWLPHRQSDDIANVQQTELIYAILLQSVVKLPSVIPAGRQCNWRSYIVGCFVVLGKFCFRTTAVFNFRFGAPELEQCVINAYCSISFVFGKNCPNFD